MLLLALIGVAFAGAAEATTLTVETDKPFYLVGETITLTVTGDTEGASALIVFGRLRFGNPGVANVAAGVPSQTRLRASTLGGLDWVAGPVRCSSLGGASCEMMNQLSPLTHRPADSTVPLTAVVSLLALAPGTSTVFWDTNKPGGFQLDFFGLTNAPGTLIHVAPEPTTAALLSLGLLALSVTRPRRA
jgi:hypothetical protein